MKTLFNVRVRVPASTGNVGPGFDAVGLALSVYNEVRLIGRSAGPALAIEIEGEGAGTISTDGSNLVLRAVQRGFRAAKRPMPPSVELRLLNRIPLARGLGSSATAIVGGLAAADAATGHRLSREDLLSLAAEMEGHPDNAAPCLFGGLTVSTMVSGRVVSASCRDKGLFRGMKLVAAVPDFELRTKDARAVLPRTVSRADAVFNVGRAVLLLAALKERRYDLLSAALEDRLHQPYRKKLIPGFDAVIAAAKRAGAFGACLSGAGPTILAFSPAAKAAAVGRAMQRAFKAKRVSSRVLMLDADRQGIRVTS